MIETTVTILVELELSEGEARLLLDHANSINKSIPTTIRSLLFEALTEKVPPFDFDPPALTIAPPPGMPDVLSDANPNP